MQSYRTSSHLSSPQLDPVKFGYALQPAETEPGRHNSFPKGFMDTLVKICAERKIEEQLCVIGRQSYC
jgi:hypothetical protein